MKKYQINDKVEFVYGHRKHYGHGFIKRACKGLFGVVYWIVQVKTLDVHKVRERDIFGVVTPKDAGMTTEFRITKNKAK